MDLITLVSALVEHQRVVISFLTSSSPPVFNSVGVNLPLPEDWFQAAHWSLHSGSPFARLGVQKSAMAREIRGGILVPAPPCQDTVVEVCIGS